MAIPDYQTVMLPLLKLIAREGSMSAGDAQQRLADEFALTDIERHELLPSGKQTIFKNRVGWASTYLKKAGLLTSSQRGTIEVTERGKRVLYENPKTINVEYLNRFPEFINFKNQSNEKIVNSPPIAEGTPEESLEDAYLQLKNQVLDEAIVKIKSCSPQFFENLVVDVVVKMGYGGSRQDAGRAVGQSGDEGIDGIINEDRLGLDVIYLQAKRWAGNVSRPEIQKFAGALQGKRAKKGIFITTSDFTSEAREFVKSVEAKIILISGRQLAELMWEFNVGFNAVAKYEIKKIDMDYLSE